MLAAFVVLAVAALGAGAGQSALGGASQSACSSAARPTRSRTSIRRATTTGVVHARDQHLRASVRREEQRQDRAVARHGLRPTRKSEDVALHAPAWRHVPRRLGLRLGGREVLVRQGLHAGHQGGGREHAVVAALQPQEREDQRALRGDVQPQGPAVDVALHPHDRCCRDRPEQRVSGQPSPEEQPAADRDRPYRLTRYTPGQQAVFEPYDDYWGPQARNDGLILRYYTKSSTMKLAVERGEIDMAFQTFTPTELLSRGPATCACTRARARSSAT